MTVNNITAAASTRCVRQCRQTGPLHETAVEQVDSCTDQFNMLLMSRDVSACSVVSLHNSVISVTLFVLSMSLCTLCSVVQPLHYQRPQHHNTQQQQQETDHTATTWSSRPTTTTTTTTPTTTADCSNSYSDDDNHTPLVTLATLLTLLLHTIID